MVRKLFQGKRKFFTIPLTAALTLYFFPFLLAIVLLLLIRKHIRYSIVKYPVMAVITLFALPIGAGWFAGMTMPAPVQKQFAGVTAPSIILSPTTIPTATPTLTPTITPVLSKKAKVTLAPTQKVTPTVYTPATKAPTKTVQPTTRTVQTQKTTNTFTCNCNKTCQQLSSCSEAQYQLNVCGCSARDADKDGIACDGLPLKCAQ